MSDGMRTGYEKKKQKSEAKTKPMDRSSPTNPRPVPPRMDIGSLLEALDAAGEETTDSSTQSSPLSYRSNGHDGLTDGESESDSDSSDPNARSAAHVPTPNGEKQPSGIVARRAALFEGRGSRRLTACASGTVSLTPPAKE